MGFRLVVTVACCFLLAGCGRMDAPLTGFDRDVAAYQKGRPQPEVRDVSQVALKYFPPGATASETAQAAKALGFEAAAITAESCVNKQRVRAYRCSHYVRTRFLHRTAVVLVFDKDMVVSEVRASSGYDGP